MSYDTVLSAINFVVENANRAHKIPGIIFFGGEPMLHWDDIILPVVKYTREKHGACFNFNMTSNCTLISDEIARQLFDYQVGVLASLDGDYITQNYNRPLRGGTGSFDSAILGAQNLMKYFGDLTIRMTVIPATCKYLYENLMFAKNAGFSDAIVVPNPIEYWSTNDKLILKNEVHKYSTYVCEQFQMGVLPFSFDNFIKNIQIMPGTAGDFIGTPLFINPCTRCGTGCNDSCGVDCDGNLYLCHRLNTGKVLNNYCIGSIFSGIDNQARLSLYESFCNNAFYGAHCDACHLTELCRGSCIANNIAINNDPFQIVEMDCWWAQLLFDECFKVVQELGNCKNQMFKESFKSIVRGKEKW